MFYIDPKKLSPAASGSSGSGSGCSGIRAMAGLLSSEVLISTSSGGGFKMWDMTAAMHQFALEGMVREHDLYVEAQHGMAARAKAGKAEAKREAKGEHARRCREEARTMEASFKAMAVAEDARKGLSHDAKGARIMSDQLTPRTTPRRSGHREEGPPVPWWGALF